MRARSTIKQVSELAGVSFKTVSRVLNREKHVGADTRRRVEDAMAALNFRPSAAARVLAGSRSFQIALLYDNPSPHYIFHLQVGAQERCGELGYRLLLQPVDSDAKDLVRQVEGLIDEVRLDGLILSSPVTEALPLVDALSARGVPFARVSPGKRPGASLAVAMDDEAAVGELIDHLVQLGHRRIGHITGPSNHSSAADRLRGFRRALRRNRVPFDPGLVAGGDYTFASGRAAAARLLGLLDPPSAIFAGNDEMAAGVIAMAHERDLSVPDALSVVGFDDSPIAQAVWPPLTTIFQPVRGLAYAATDLLLGRNGDVRSFVLGHRFVERASTGRAAPA